MRPRFPEFHAQAALTAVGLSGAVLIYLEGELSVGPLFTLSCLQHTGCVRLGLVFPSLPYGAFEIGQNGVLL